MTFDVVVIGAGIAGASIAAELAGTARVLLLEAESLPGRHATGRSAAFWSQTYGGPLVEPLTTASGPFLACPPADFAERSFLSPRGELHIADSAGCNALADLEAEFADTHVRLDPLDRAALEAILPGLCAGWTHGLIERSCQDIDVAALHAAYLRQARQSGAELVVDAAVIAAHRRPGSWRVVTAAATYEGALVVNAAGAWADQVAAMFGARPLGVAPYRRTMVQLRTTPPPPPDLPLVMDARGRFYFKPEAGSRLWLSPHDESPCVPHDCAPEELDIATAVDRFEQVVDWRVERVERSWAGLRSFAPDRLPVYGFDPVAPGLFWFAGQGGFGIQTAPAAARLAASLLLGTAPHPSVAAIDPAPYAPARFG